MTKIVDVHTFDSFVQNNVNEKYNKFDFNGSFHDEFEKWLIFINKIIIEKKCTKEQKYKINEMFMQLEKYGKNTYVPGTLTKIATLMQIIISKLENKYNNNKSEFDIIWGYFLEFYSEPLSTHCPEGISNRAYFILELSKDYINM
jgi:hypothetical protein